MYQMPFQSRLGGVDHLNFCHPFLPLNRISDRGLVPVK